MRNHHGRFVLAACLATAAAAQAPTLDNSKFREVGGAAAERGKPAAEPATGRTLGDYTPRYADATGYQDGQNPDRYSMNAIFRKNHGDFLDRRERFDPAIELSARLLPHEQIKHEPGSFDMVGYDIDARLPVLVSTEGYLTFGAYYQGRSYDFSSRFGTRNNSTSLSDETLHALGVHLGFGVFLDDNVLFEMETSPGAWTDADAGLHHQDFDFPSRAMFTLRAMDRLFFKIGARYNQIFEEAPWLPYLGISVEVVEGFRIDILAPESAELSFWPNPSTGLLFGAEVNGAEYHVRTTEATGNQRANVRVQETVVYFGLLQRFTDNFSFRGRIGAVVGGDYELTSGAATFDPADGTLASGLYAEISFGIDF